jgi:hypothetical protein
MVTLTFADRSQIIVNLQKPLHEVWMAARSGGFHYKWDGNSWRDTKTRAEFFADLSRYASEQAARAARLQFLNRSRMLRRSSAGRGGDRRRQAVGVHHGLVARGARRLFAGRAGRARARGIGAASAALRPRLATPLPRA